MISCTISDTISVYAEYNLPELLRESKCLVVEVSNWVAEAYPQPWCILLGSCPNNQAYFEESGRRVQGPQETSAEWKEVQVGPHNRANHLRPYCNPHCYRCQNHCDRCDGPWKEHLTKQKVISAEIKLIHDIISDIGYIMTRYRIVQTISVYQNSVTDIGTHKNYADIGPDMTNLRRYRPRYDADIGVNYGVPVSCHFRYREFRVGPGLGPADASLESTEP